MEKLYYVDENVVWNPSHTPYAFYLHFKGNTTHSKCHHQIKAWEESAF
jgi:hypothetical protein